jgi:hypothetical protein
MTSFAAFIKESRMSFAEPIGLNRKSGAAEGSAVPRTFLGNVFRQRVPGFSTAQHRTGPRVLLSVKKAACSSLNPQSPTGNPGKRSGAPAVQLSPKENPHDLYEAK